MTTTTNQNIVRNDSAAMEAKLLRAHLHKSRQNNIQNSVTTCGNCQPVIVDVGFGAGLCTWLYGENKLINVLYNPYR